MSSNTHHKQPPRTLGRSILSKGGQSAALIVLLLGMLLVWGCASGPEEIPEGLTPLQYFQRAQDAISRNNDYDTALEYYRTFIRRHPDNAEKVVEAEYEIAFIYYKRGYTETAEKMFKNLLSYYEGEGAEVLPPWPRVLAEKLLEDIQEQ